MKVLYISILLFLSIMKVYGFNEWELVDKLQGIPQAIECYNTNNCYINTSRGHPFNLYKSSDEGNNWSKIESIDNIKGVQSTHDLSVPDSLNIFLSFNKGVICKTTDGAETFECIKLDTELPIHSITMYDKNLGIAFTNLEYFITYDGWIKSNKYSTIANHILYLYRGPIFINDSTIVSIAGEYDTLKPVEFMFIQTVFIEFNIKTHNKKINIIDNEINLLDLQIINKDLLFICGKSHEISGGSGHDAIYKSTDTGESWRRVLDLSYYHNVDDSAVNPFGLQSIAFKDSLTGIAVGQFGKIVYTYDGGESWQYEAQLHDSIAKKIPPTMLVKYIEDTPIIATYSGEIYKLKQDNLAPKADDTLTISGRVWEGEKGQSGIPVALNTYRITMTDEEGYYKFTNLAPDSYTVKALNKYNPYQYFPFIYHPTQYEFELTNDTTGIDFNAEDIRNYYSLYGSVKDENGEGIADIEIQMNNYLYNPTNFFTTTDINGNYKFENYEGDRLYTITPKSKIYEFTPASQDIPLNSVVYSVDFTVQTKTSVTEESTNALHFSIFPNPTTNELNIYFDSDLQQNASIDIYDILGRKVFELPKFYSENQQSNIVLNIEELRIGSYICVINLNGNVQTKIFTKYK